MTELDGNKYRYVVRIDPGNVNETYVFDYDTLPEHRRVFASAAEAEEFWDEINEIATRYGFYGERGRFKWTKEALVGNQIALGESGKKFVTEVYEYLKRRFPGADIEN